MLSIIAAVAGESFVDIARLASSSSSHHHVLLALPLSAWLAIRDQRARAVPSAPDYLGAAALALTLLVWIVGRAGSIAVVEHAGAVLAIGAAAIAAYGRARAAAWAPALLLVVFAIPFGDELTPQLQNLSADAVEAMLRVIGAPATRNELVFSTPVGAFEIAESCAGLRFLAAALMISTLAAALFLQTSWKRLAFVALAALLALAANWLRATAIIAGAIATERRFGVGVDHLYFGWVIYVGLLGALIGVAYRFREPVADRAPVAAHPAAPHALVAFAAVAAVMLGYQAFIDWRGGRTATGFDLTPPAARGWRLTTAHEDWRATAEGADGRALWAYWSISGTVVVDAAHFARDRNGAEIAGWGVRAADGKSWRRVGAVDVAWREAPGRAAQAQILANDAGERRYVVIAYWTGEEARHSRFGVKAHTTLMRLAGRPTDGGAMFLASDSLPALSDFASDLEPLSLWAAQRRDRPLR
jgi:exosortase